MNIQYKYLASVCLYALLSVFSMGVSAADTADLEKRLKMLEEEVMKLRQELATATSAPAEPVKQVESRVTKLENWANTQPSKVAGNMVFFRGGYASLNDDRGYGAFTDVNGLGNALGVTPINDGDTGWYVGAGFDFLLSRDTLGLLPNTWTMAELSVEFSHLSSERTLMTGPLAVCLLAGGALGTCGALVGDQDLTMLTVSASPKLKFMEGSKFRPWIIPVGLDFHVISPPSDSTNYIDVGAQFAAGAEYELIPGINLGADFRYHLLADFTSPDYNLTAAQRAALGGLGIGVNDDADNDYWTVGAYLGIGF